MPDFTYWAFITYSHADTKWCEWLHKSLETYRIPSHLVGVKQPDFNIPKKLFPVFRDREDLSLAPDLTERIQIALRQSRNLIVICSPSSAKSKWVNEEVRYFKMLGKGERIYCFIIDGEPNASSRPDLALEECYPETVRFQLSTDGNILDKPVDPLAADARKGKDGKRMALLKLVSAIIEIDFDKLKQRSEERRLRFLAMSAVSMLVLVVVMGFLTWSALTGQRKAIENQSQLLLRTALIELENDEGFSAKNNLARAIELDSNNKTAAARLVTLLTQRQFPQMTGKYLSHKGRVWSLEFDKYSRKLFSASHDGSISLMDVAANNAIPQTYNSEGANKFTAHSKDGRFIVAATDRQVLNVWDTRHAHALTRVRLASDITDMSLSGDSVTIAVALANKNDEINESGGVTIWKILEPGVAKDADAKDTTPVAKIQLKQTLKLQDSEKIESVFFIPETSLLLTSSDKGLVVLWDLSHDGEPVRLLKIENSTPVLKMAYSTKRRLIATASKDNVVKIWDANSGSLIENAFSFEGLPKKLQFNIEENKLLLQSTAEKIYVWDVDKKIVLPYVGQHKAAISDARFLSDNATIITAAWDGTAKIWQPSTRFPIPEPMRHSLPVFSIVAGDAEHEFFTGGEDGTIRKWVYPKSKFLFGDIDLEKGVNSVKRSRTGKKILFLTADHSEILVLEFVDNKISKHLIKKDIAILSMDISPDGRYIVLVLADGTLSLYDDKLGKEKKLTQNDALIKAEYLINSNIVLLFFANNSLRLWDINHDFPTTLLMKHNARVSDAKIFPGHRNLVSITSNNILTLWDVQTGLPYRSTKQLSAPVNSLMIANDGRLYVASGKEVSIYKVANNSLDLVDKIPHPETVWSINISSDNKLIATTCFDGVTRIWARDNFKYPNVKIIQKGIVNKVQFSQSGKWLLTAGHDGKVVIWDASNGVKVSDTIDAGSRILTAQFGFQDQTVVSATDSGAINFNEVDMGLDEHFPPWLAKFGLAVGQLTEQDADSTHTIKRPGLEIDQDKEDQNSKWAAWTDKVVLQNYQLMRRQNESK